MFFLRAFKQLLRSKKAGRFLHRSAPFAHTAGIKILLMCKRNEHNILRLSFTQHLPGPFDLPGNSMLCQL